MNEAAPIRRDLLLLLAMCPALAVSDTVVNAIGLGLAVLVCAPLAAVLFLAVRRWLTPETQLTGALLSFAGVIACLELLMRAWFHELHAALGVFLPLLAVNIVIAAALTVTDKSRAASLLDVVRASAAVALILLVLGVARELVGRGSILHDAGPAFGDWAQPLDVNVFSVDMGFLLGMLPPGAFISLGLLLAARNWIARHRTKKHLHEQKESH